MPKVGRLSVTKYFSRSIGPIFHTWVVRLVIDTYLAVPTNILQILDPKSSLGHLGLKTHFE